MGRESTGRGDGSGGREGDRPGGPGRPYADLNAAAAASAFQLPAIGLIWWIGNQLGDDHGTSVYGFFVLFGLACLLVIAPLVLPVVGLVHAMVHIMPADFLARAAVRHARGPRWAWHLVCTALLGVGWAGLTALLYGWTFGVTAPLFAALGVLPVLGLAYLRRRSRITGRPWGPWGAWLPSLFASVGLFLLVFVGGVLATVTGLVEDYEPPVLSAEQLAGDWRGDHGAVLRLRPDGHAELTKVPAQPEYYDDSADPPDPVFTRCDGTGSWDRRSNDPDGSSERDGVLVRLRGGCGDDTYWMIGGTAAEPELFVLFGDPDAAELRILKRDS
ncbi:hypothetical protein [Streptomyces viridochromogenes]|uniref:Putative Integral membrane protein n=1 Tax=Streptomyces viridochromogenes Tue57 TaxID=1160705 RepID=L8P923_STRVR|nr:hypothetical protein [Streptomyces viridochromogenes]ELS54081.1 putative Integral membrane protein [Streptomyces viridochromogenes Tue57]